MALKIRIAFVLILYLFFYFTTNQPFEFDAADSIFYHEWGTSLSNLILSGNFDLFESLQYISFSDRGYPLFLGLIYPIGFQTILFPRIVNAFLGAWTCVFIYRIAKRNFNEKTGRIAGVMSIFLPNLIYYTGLHLKETLMIFLLVFFIERADDLLKFRKVTFRKTLTIGILGLSLFLFRTVLGVTAFSSLFCTLVFSSSRFSSWQKRIHIAVWIGLFLILFFSDRILLEMSEYWNEQDSNLQSQMTDFSTHQGANNLAVYGSAAVFAPLILFGPFPTMVEIKGQENHMMLAGAFFTRNVYAFFVVIGFLAIIKQKVIRKHLLLLLFILFYLTVLAKSGFALSERFHLPVVPFLIILASYGITKVNKRNKKYFVPYLIIISIIIIGWNWFKLAGRDLV